jgi:hypothetical protein
MLRAYAKNGLVVIKAGCTSATGEYSGTMLADPGMG